MRPGIHPRATVGVGTVARNEKKRKLNNEQGHQIHTMGRESGGTWHSSSIAWDIFTLPSRRNHGPRNDPNVPMTCEPNTSSSRTKRTSLTGHVTGEAFSLRISSTLLFQKELDFPPQHLPKKKLGKNSDATFMDESEVSLDIIYCLAWFRTLLLHFLEK